MDVTGVMNRRKKIPSIGAIGGSTCVFEPEGRKSGKVNKPVGKQLTKKVMQTRNDVSKSWTGLQDVAHNLLSNVVRCKERDSVTTWKGIDARGTQEPKEATKYGRTRARRFGISMERAGACWAQGAWVRFSLWGTCW